MGSGAKLALRRFAEAAAGFRGKDGAETFARGLIGCFGEVEREGLVYAHPISFVDSDQKRAKRTLAAFWGERRVVVEVADRDLTLDLAWKDMLRAVLELEPTPQYVVLTNQRDVRLYDLSRKEGKQEARLSIALDELPKYSEAFPFFADRLRHRARARASARAEPWRRVLATGAAGDA